MDVGPNPAMLPGRVRAPLLRKAQLAAFPAPLPGQAHPRRQTWWHLEARVDYFSGKARALFHLGRPYCHSGDERARLCNVFGVHTWRTGLSVDGPVELENWIPAFAGMTGPSPSKCDCPGKANPLPLHCLRADAIILTVGAVFSRLFALIGGFLVRKWKSLIYGR